MRRVRVSREERTRRLAHLQLLSYGINDLTTVLGVVVQAPFARSGRKGRVKEVLERAGKFNPDVFVCASMASARAPGSSRFLL